VESGESRVERGYGLMVRWFDGGANRLPNHQTIAPSDHYTRSVDLLGEVVLDPGLFDLVELSLELIHMAFFVAKD